LLWVIARTESLACRPATKALSSASHGCPYFDLRRLLSDTGPGCQSALDDNGKPVKRAKAQHDAELLCNTNA
jgi:hypothetical protein